MFGKKDESWPKKYARLLLEAAIFGIGVEVGKDLYRLVRDRRLGGEDAPPPLDDGGLDDGGGEAKILTER